MNERDVAEETLHIQSMARIYANAKRAIVWFGEEADGSTEKPDRQAQIAAQAEPQPCS